MTVGLISMVEWLNKMLHYDKCDRMKKAIWYAIAFSSLVQSRLASALPALWLQVVAWARAERGEDSWEESEGRGAKKEGREAESWVVGAAGLQASICGLAGSVPKCCWGVLGESSRLPTEMPESVLWLRPLAAHASSSGSASSSFSSHRSSTSSKGNDLHSHGCTVWNFRKNWKLKNWKFSFHSQFSYIKTDRWTKTPLEMLDKLYWMLTSIPFTLLRKCRALLFVKINTFRVHKLQIFVLYSCERYS